MTKVRKGMVFMFDPYPTVDKNNPIVIKPNGYGYKSELLHGYRPYIVVSNDNINSQGRVCIMVACHSKKNKIASINNHPALFSYKGKVAYLAADNIVTVSQSNIDTRKYIGTLSDMEMRIVDDAVVGSFLGKQLREISTDKEEDFNDFDELDYDDEFGSDDYDCQDEIDDEIDELEVVSDGPEFNTHSTITVTQTTTVESFGRKNRDINVKVNNFQCEALVSFEQMSIEELYKVVDYIGSHTRSEILDKYNIKRGSYTHVINQIVYLINGQKPKREVVMSKGIIIRKPTNAEAIQFIADNGSCLTDDYMKRKYNLTSKELVAYLKYISTNMM